ncbi:MAG: ShlB/FhaC/HecB family hemolysin secretion/activation protein [Pseudanabaenaceae cyanobacterium]
MRNLLITATYSAMLWVSSGIGSTLQAQEVTNPQSSFLVREIRVVGATILSPEEISRITRPFENRPITLADLRQVANQITSIYQERNYITSRAIIPPDQNLQAGVVTIQVLEGTLERIEITRTPDSTEKLLNSYLRDRILLGADPPLNFTKLEEELQLLRNDPLISQLTATLFQGSQPNTSILRVTFREAPSLFARPFVDNYGNVSTGIIRTGITIQELNASRIGDVLTFNYTRGGTADGYGISYKYPVNPRGGTVAVNFSGSNNPFTFGNAPPLAIVTNSQILEFTYRQPLVRSIRQEFALSLGLALEGSFSSLNGVSFNFQNGVVDDGLSQSRVIKFGQDYLSRDEAGAWVFRSSFNLGIGGLGATIRENAPDGRFFTWIGQALRVQRIGGDRDSLVFLRVNAQLATDSLLSLNKFGLGGVPTVRGYRQNQLVGDNGVQASVEFQFPIAKDDRENAILKLHPFLEGGTVWNFSGLNPDPQALVSVGLGVSYQPLCNLNLRVDVGVPLVNANNPGTNLQDSGIHFSINGNF